MTASRVILLRHGQTDWNLNMKWQGQTDVPLNATGLDQARQAAGVLANTAGDVVRVVTSDLARARVTAQIAAERIAEAGGSPGEVIGEPRLREFQSGGLEGLGREDIMARYADSVRSFRAGEDEPLGETGERPTQVADRTMAAFTEHAAATPDGGALLLVGHGGALRILVYRVLRMQLPWVGLSIVGNCHWSVLRPEPVGDESVWHLNAWNHGATAR